MVKNRQKQKAKRDLAGAAARASGKAKGRRDHNNTFPHRRISEHKAQSSNSNNNNDDLFAYPFPHQSLSNFYYPPALHSYQNSVNGFGVPGYAGYYILNQPYPAPVPQYYPSVQPITWGNRDFEFFDRVQLAGPQQRSQPPQHRARTNGPAQKPQIPKAMENVPVITVSGTWQPRPEAPEFVPKKIGEFEGSGSSDKENIVVKLPASPSKTGLTTDNMPTPKL
ncbi:hypothetical protein VTN00DRAFT_9253 [Thermoascus crustaceus]|uniref:uncharacterized protein n=1 Tax=Thermoascus crustaceus TaxID=5088 RepID=UPI0037442C9C